MILTLPWPPSVNHYWRTVNGRPIISKAGREYREAVRSCAWGAGNMGDARLSVAIAASPPDRRRRDLDNVLKALLDAMQHAGVYDDDSQIDKLTITRAKQTNGGAVAVKIEEA